MILETSYWPADTSRPVLDTTVGELLKGCAAAVPHKRALISVASGCAARAWAYGELLADAEHAAAWLSMRFSPGEHIAVWAPNVPEWLILQYGAALAGMVLVTINPALRESELQYALDKSRSVGLFYVDNLRGTDMASTVRAVLPAVSGLREAVPFEGWLETVRATDARSDLPAVDPHSATQVQFTSGTTGRPKAVVLKHMSMVTNASYCRKRCGAEYGATFGTALPFFHTAGCGLAVMGSFAQQATVVVAEVFDPPTVLSAIEDFQVEVFGGVPRMLHAMIEDPKFESFDLSSLNQIMSGGDAIPPGLIERWAAATGVGFSAVYGQTELSPVVTQTSPSDGRAEGPHNAGRPLPHVEVAILDPLEGTVQPLGTEGEICARGYQQMIGYLDMPDETAKTIDADGWLHTGDLGTLDAQGFLTVTGRLKDMIIRGGENIYPREIEDALCRHSSVTSAMVLGLQDEAWGETVGAVLQLDTAEPVPTPAELTVFLRERLAPHKTPKTWYVTDEPPTNALGKLQKFRLKEQIDSGRLRTL